MKLPMTTDAERKRLTDTLEYISSNAAIRTEITCKRREGKSVEQACAEIAEEFNVSMERARNIYYAR